METFLQFKEQENFLRKKTGIELLNVSVKYGNKLALNNVSLKLNQGDVLFVTGVSGAGKTTLLNVLAQDIVPTSGKTIFPGDESSFFIAQVFQDLRLLNYKTCEENLWISFDKKIYTSKNEFYAELVELSKILGVYEYLNLKVQDANGGLKQKVAMIRALLSKPNIILADEPTAALDKESSLKLYEVLQFYNIKKGLTVVWATHNRDLIRQFPGNIAHLDKGKLIYSGNACFI